MASLPVVAAAWIIVPRWVDVPVWDDWERGPLFQKYYAGELGWSDLYAPHINHRIVVPRLVTIALNGPANADVRRELGVIFAVIAAAAFGVVRLAKTTPGGGTSALVPFLLSALLISPMQYQNFLWAGTLGLILPTSCMVAAVLVWQAPWPLAWRWFGVCLLSLIASHCFAQGLFVWPCLLGLLLVSSRTGGLKSRVIAAGMYALVAAVVIAFYVTDLKNVSDPAHAYNDVVRDPKSIGLAAFMADPGRFALFFTRTLGSPLCRGLGFQAPEAGFVIGTGLLSAFIVCSLAVLHGWKDEKFREAALPWLVLGAFSIVCGAAVAWGRSGFLGAHRALSPRYITLVHLLPACLVVLVPLVVHRRIKGPAVERFGLVAGGVCTMWLFLTWTAAVPPVREWHSARLQGKAELMLLNVARRSHTHLITGATELLEAQAAFLDSKRMLNPPLLRQPWLDAFEIKKGAVSPSRGAIDPPVASGNKIVLSGFAAVPGSGRAADAVLICAEDGGRLRIHAIADPKLTPGEPLFHVDYEFTPRHYPDHKNRWGWEAQLPARLFKSKTDWSAWILDVENMCVRRIPGKM